MNGYANLIAARLRKLADEGSTGMLPVAGEARAPSSSAAARWVYAESSRTPLPGPRASGPGRTRISERLVGTPSRSPAHRGYTGGAGVVACGWRVGWLRGLLELTELVIDALTELLSSESRYAKSGTPTCSPSARAAPWPWRRCWRRSSGAMRCCGSWPRSSPRTPRSAASRSSGPPSAQVSPTQWALLARAAEVTTPRGLAMQLGRSVFGTTIEAYRLVELGLLVVPGRPPGPADGRLGAGISFIRAVAGGRGSDALPTVGDRPDHRGAAADQAERARGARQHHRHQRRAAGRARHARP